MTENDPAPRLHDAQHAPRPRPEFDHRPPVQDRRLTDPIRSGKVDRGEVPAGASRCVAEHQAEPDRGIAGVDHDHEPRRTRTALERHGGPLGADDPQRPVAERRFRAAQPKQGPDGFAQARLQPAASHGNAPRQAGSLPPRSPTSSP